MQDRVMQNAIMDSFNLTRIIDAVLLTVAFLFNAVILDASLQSILIAVGGSVSGAIILAYLRQDARWLEQFFKVSSSAISGIVFGTVIVERWALTAPAYRLGVFFTSSLLSLVVLRALLTLTENNIADVLRSLLQRIFNLKTPAERKRRKEGN